MSTLSPFSFLARNAAENPAEIFARSLTQTLTNAQACASARQLAAEFRAQGMHPGDLVALRLPDMLGLLVSVALMHEAAIGAPLPSTGLPPTVQVDWFITDAQSRRNDVPGVRVIVLDAELMRRAQARTVTDEPRAFPNMSSPVRVSFSSGTTGVPKGIATSLGVLDHYGATARTSWLRGDPFLVLMPLGTLFGIVAFYASLIHGLPYLLVGGADAREVLRVIEANGVTNLVGSPAQVAAVIDGAQEHRIRLPQLRGVLTAGSVMPAALVRRLREISPLCEAHTLCGSTEGTLLTERYEDSDDPMFIGYVSEGSEVEIVDEDGVPVAAGQVGRIRHRNPHMATGYIGDPEATRKAFIDGWFYPGDLARFRADGGIVLSGRVSERLNAGGVKVDANVLDLFSLDQAGVVDAAAFLVRDEGGVDRIALAVVPRPEFEVRPFLESLSARFGAASPAVLVRVDAIPRNTMGKPLRRELADGYRG